MGWFFTWIDGSTTPYEVMILAGMVAGFSLGRSGRHASRAYTHVPASVAGFSRCVSARFFAKAVDSSPKIGSQRVSSSS